MARIIVRSKWVEVLQNMRHQAMTEFTIREGSSVVGNHIKRKENDFSKSVFITMKRPGESVVECY